MSGAINPLSAFLYLIERALMHLLLRRCPTLENKPALQAQRNLSYQPDTNLGALS